MDSPHPGPVDGKPVGTRAGDAGGDTGGRPGDRPGSVVVLAYDGAGADEAGALVEILTLAGVSVVIASVEAKPVTSYHGRLVPERAASGLGPVAALVVPGGMGVRTAAANPILLDAIERLGRRATWLGATSTGSVLLAAAGLADHARITTHWLAGALVDTVGERSIEVVDAPFVEHGRLLTAGGPASTATLAFRLVGAIAGVEAEDRTRAHYAPKPDSDSRYQRPDRGRLPARVRRALSLRGLGRKRVDDEYHPFDPRGEAEVVIIDLDAELGR